MTYPHERQVEYYVSRAIEDDFEQKGYKVVPIPNSQYIEKVIPADHLFFASNVFKVFGLQYKRLKENPDHWSLDIVQLEHLKPLGWLFYALPIVREFADLLDHTSVLNQLKIVEPSQVPTAYRAHREVNLYLTRSVRAHTPVPTIKWNEFVTGILDCHYGVAATTIIELQLQFDRAQLLAADISELLAIARREPKVVLRQRYFSDEPLG